MEATIVLTINNDLHAPEWGRARLPSHLTGEGAWSTKKWCSQRHRAINKSSWGASLVAQWLRICLPMQGTRVWALVWEDPTGRGATRPVSHDYWACASGGCAPQRERPQWWEARAPQRERPRWWEARAPRWRVAPACRKWRKPSHRNEDPTGPKINNK